MKHIYIEVSEEMYTDAKRLGFFESKEIMRTALGNFIARSGVAHDNKDISKKTF